MWKCPVCEELNSNDDELLCRNCGFDDSRDYVRYPTLMTLSGTQSAVCRRKEKKGPTGVWACPSCGKCAVSIMLPQFSYKCLSCGTAFSKDEFEATAKMQLRVNSLERIAAHRIAAGGGLPGPWGCGSIVDKRHLGCTVCLREDGRVFAVGQNDIRQCYTNTSRWNDIIAVAASPWHTLGLRRDGTVVSTGCDDNGQCSNVRKWKDIVAVSASKFQTVGLCYDGTVIATGDDSRNRNDVRNWKDIVAVSTGQEHILGLRSDGTVIATGHFFYKINTESYLGMPVYLDVDVDNWRDIIAISSSDDHAVGLRKDGTVIAAGDNRCQQCDVMEWKNIIAVAAGLGYTVGLRQDGTLLATGKNERGQCNVENWKNVIEISAGVVHTVGLCEDGSILTTDTNFDAKGLTVMKAGFSRSPVSF